MDRCLFAATNGKKDKTVWEGKGTFVVLVVVARDS